jgi:tRNA(fMet)-specific endonuclease VapC
VRLEGRQVVLDTNVLVHLIRGGDAGRLIEQHYGVGARRPRAVVPVVVKGEIKSLALQFGWGAKKQGQLDALLAQLPTVDIASDPVVTAYAQLDDASRKQGRTMGKNDVWIAAVTMVQKGVLLTTDQDFDHLANGSIEREYIDPAQLLQGKFTARGN